MHKIISLFKECRESESSFFLTAVRHLLYKIYGKNILAGCRLKIKGVKNIQTNGVLRIGLNYVGFMHKNDRTHLNINGSLIFHDSFSIGKGCRFDIGSNAVAEFGSNSGITSNATFIIMHGIKVGDSCVISWGCQFMDDDFHRLSYQGRKEKDPPIELGNHVWIGSNVTVLKGSKIPDGCVVASGSVVCSKFDKPHCLIAGNPAKIIREDVSWE